MIAQHPPKLAHITLPSLLLKLRTLAQYPPRLLNLLQTLPQISILKIK